MAVRKVTVHNYPISTNDTWKEPFNQATFFNYDTTAVVTIKNLGTIPPAQVVGAGTYPGYLTVALNVGEVNDSHYVIDFGGSDSANLVIIYTQYVGVESEL